MTTDPRTPADRPRRRIDIDIDTDSCVGSATCVSVAEWIFALGRDGKATVVDPEPPVDEELVDTIDEAAESCPVSAISWRPVDEGEWR
jgi:ferredoxin